MWFAKISLLSLRILHLNYKATSKSDFSFFLWLQFFLRWWARRWWRRWLWGGRRWFAFLLLSLLSLLCFLYLFLFLPFLIFHFFLGILLLFTFILRLLLAAGLIFNIDSFVILISNYSFWAFVFVELKFNFFLVHDSRTRSVSVSCLIFALVGVVAELETSLASDNSRSFTSCLFFHSIINIALKVTYHLKEVSFIWWFSLLQFTIFCWLKLRFYLLLLIEEFLKKLKSG